MLKMVAVKRNEIATRGNAEQRTQMKMEAKAAKEQAFVKADIAQKNKEANKQKYENNRKLAMAYNFVANEVYNGLSVEEIKNKMLETDGLHIVDGFHSKRICDVCHTALAEYNNFKSFIKEHKAYLKGVTTGKYFANKDGWNFYWQSTREDKQNDAAYNLCIRHINVKAKSIRAIIETAKSDIRFAELTKEEIAEVLISENGIADEKKQATMRQQCKVTKFKYFKNACCNNGRTSEEMMVVRAARGRFEIKQEVKKVASIKQMGYKIPKLLPFKNVHAVKRVASIKKVGYQIPQIFKLA